MTIGNQLTALRRVKGLGLREAARGAGISASTLSRAERDLGNPDTAIIGRLAAFYDVSFESLLDAYEPTQEQTGKFLIGLGYNLEALRAEINGLIDELQAEASAILAQRETP